MYCIFMYMFVLYFHLKWKWVTVARNTCTQNVTSEVFGETAGGETQVYVVHIILNAMRLYILI